MTNEERKTAILDLWHDIAMDRSLQVSLRLKASEYEAKALGLIGDQPGVTILNEPDEVTKQLQAMTLEQLEALASADTSALVEISKSKTAQEARKAREAVVVGSKPVSARKTAKKPLKTRKTASIKKVVKK
jgi:hypothetical protein